MVKILSTPKPVAKETFKPIPAPEKPKSTFSKAVESIHNTFKAPPSMSSLRTLRLEKRNEFKNLVPESIRKPVKAVVLKNTPKPVKAVVLEGRTKVVKAVVLKSAPKQLLLDYKASGIFQKTYSPRSEVHFLYSQGNLTEQIKVIDKKNQTVRHGYLQDGIMVVQPFPGSLPIDANDFLQPSRNFLIHLGTRIGSVKYRKPVARLQAPFNGSCEKVTIKNGQISAFVKRQRMDLLPAQSKLS